MLSFDLPTAPLALVLMLGPTPLAAGSMAEQPRDVEVALSEYLDGLGRLRGGDDTVLEALRETGRRLCELHGRCDAVDVLEFYAGLSPDERRAGLEAEREYRGIHEFVWELSNEGVPEGESWAALREEVCQELGELIEATEFRPDFTPAARAHALLAELLLSSDTGTSERLDRVRGHVDRAIELFGRAGQITPQLEPLWVLGKIQRARGEAGLARQTFARCRELAGRLGRPEYEEKALLGLVRLAKDVGDWREVDRLLSELASFRGPGDSWPLAREHATRLVHLDQPEAALRFLLNYPPQAASYDAEWHTMLSSAFLRSGDLTAARREMMELEDAGEELRELTWASLDLAHEDPADVVDRLARYADQGESGGASFATWSPHGRVQAWSFLGEAALALARPDEALRWLTCAVEGADEWDEVRADEGSGSVVGEWLGLHVVVLLARAHIELGQPFEAACVIEDFQSRRLRAVATDAEGGHALAGTRVDGDVLLDWSRRFEGGIVTWAVGADHGVVAHVGRDGEAWASAVPHGRRAVQTAVRRLREASVAGDPGRAQELAGQIVSGLLPGGIQARLARLEPGARTLFLLHGALEALPLSLLEIDGELLDERLTLLVLPGLPRAQTPANGPRTDWTLLGSPAGHDGDEPVRFPGAAREIAGLGRLYPGARSFTGASFTKAAVLDALAAHGPLHIATHLVNDERCEGSTMAAVGLELSGDDVLCAKDIEAMRPRLPLVVLTACETAGGRFIDGEGMHGISRAFLESGTTNLVTTLWPVEDEAARRFSQHLHGALARGVGPAQTTALARRTLRTGGAPPADWAAFRFMGSD